MNIKKAKQSIEAIVDSLIEDCRRREAELKTELMNVLQRRAELARLFDER